MSKKCTEISSNYIKDLQILQLHLIDINIDLTEGKLARRHPKSRTRVLLLGKPNYLYFVLIRFRLV